MIEEIEKLNVGIVVGDARISILLFADDIALLARDKKSMQLMLDCLAKYSRKWRFKFNIAKCETVLFGLSDRACDGHNKTSCTCPVHFKLCNQLLKNSRLNIWG